MSHVYFVPLCVPGTIYILIWEMQICLTLLLDHEIIKERDILISLYFNPCPALNSALDKAAT